MSRSSTSSNLAAERTLLVNARRLMADGLILIAFEDITERKRAAEARYRRCSNPRATES